MRHTKNIKGFQERIKTNTQNLDDLVRWLEYGKTTGFTAIRNSREQEELWGLQLKELLAKGY